VNGARTSLGCLGGTANTGGNEWKGSWTRNMESCGMGIAVVLLESTRAAARVRAEILLIGRPGVESVTTHGVESGARTSRLIGNQGTRGKKQKEGSETKRDEEEEKAAMERRPRAQHGQ